MISAAFQFEIMALMLCMGMVLVMKCIASYSQIKLSVSHEYNSKKHSTWYK